MVTITPHAHQWRALIECNLCHTARIEQFHMNTKPQVAVESAIKTTARTLGWHVGSQSAVCGACRRQK